MRGRLICVLMITLCLPLCGCGDESGQDVAAEARAPYQTMERCTMTAEVSTAYGQEVSAFTLRCDYTPESSTVEVLSPETAAGVQAVLDGDGTALVYGGDCLPAGTRGSEKLSPASCLPRLMSALRSGWLLEENGEQWNDVSCLRLGLEQTGENGGKVISTLWLNEESYEPVRGEIAVGGEIILQAEFTEFEFGAILKNDGEAAAG